MNTFILLIICSLGGGLLSLLGGIFLLKHKKSSKIADLATAFAAGALLSAAFFDLLPEALEPYIEAAEPNLIPPLFLTLFGILAFFLLEQSVHWFHHHKYHDSHAPTAPIVPLLIISDTIHNAVDGIAIAAAFLVSPSTGIVTVLAVAAHEVPQEIGDFAIMLKNGVKKSKVFIINLLASFATVVAAVLFFIIGEAADISAAPVLALTAGFFIYIAVSDIIPEIHNSKNQRLQKSVLLLIGVILVAALTSILHI
jgi:zinc and cadmium transporter